MRMLPVFLALLTACGPTFLEAPSERAEAARSRTVTLQAVDSGSDWTLEVSGLISGDKVHLFRTEAGLGVGTCYPQLQGDCFDLLEPIALVHTVVADAAGLVSQPIGSEASASWQAVWMDAGTAVVSTTVTFDASGALEVPAEPEPTPTGDVCYPGESADYDACADVVPSSQVGSGYGYPSPLSSNYDAPTAYLDLDVEDPALKVAPNFRLDELAQAWKGQFGVVQLHAVERLQDLRDELGVLHVNSGYRSPSYNSSVGGATHSRHMYGDAFDMSASSASLDDLADSCAANGAGYIQIYTTHVHCDWRDDAQQAPFYGSRSAPGPVLADPEPEVAVHQLGRTLSVETGDWDCGTPRVRWFVLDAEGELLDVVDAPELDLPEGAAGVQVDVGGRVLRQIRL